ncbi:hypothetical protein Q1695_014810 [Nippostrongylus brasiliensis]|nr:hypothetical protein Q1695_014810 [Nippostrongylus brasiliensis]
MVREKLKKVERRDCLTLNPSAPWLSRKRCPSLNLYSTHARLLAFTSPELLNRSVHRSGSVRLQRRAVCRRLPFSEGAKGSSYLQTELCEMVSGVAGKKISLLTPYRLPLT